MRWKESRGRCCFGLGCTWRATRSAGLAGLLGWLLAGVVWGAENWEDSDCFELDASRIARLITLSVPGIVAPYLEPAIIRSRAEMDELVNNVGMLALEQHTEMNAERIRLRGRIAVFRRELVDSLVDFEEEALVILRYSSIGTVAADSRQEATYHGGRLRIERTETVESSGMNELRHFSHLVLAVDKEKVESVELRVNGRIVSQLPIRAIEVQAKRSFPPAGLELRVFPHARPSAEADARKSELSRAAVARGLDHVPGVYIVNLIDGLFPYERVETIDGRGREHHIYDRTGVSAAEWASTLVEAVGGILLYTFAEGGFSAILSPEQLRLLEEVSEVASIREIGLMDLSSS